MITNEDKNYIAIKYGNLLDLSYSRTFIAFRDIPEYIKEEWAYFCFIDAKPVAELYPEALDFIKYNVSSKKISIFTIPDPISGVGAYSRAIDVCYSLFFLKEKHYFTSASQAARATKKYKEYQDKLYELLLSKE